MSGIQFEWDVDSDVQVHKAQPSSQGRKRRWLRAILFLLFPILLISLIVGFLAFQLGQIERENIQLLNQTVQAEVAALRLGDEETYLDFQRSATSDWQNAQQNYFAQIQERKLVDSLELSGNVISTEIDDSRARVQVEEIVNGVPYVNTWFYWHYDEEEDRGGWRHVPPDYTFWGDEDVITSDHYRIQFSSVDTLFAQQMEADLDEWYGTACEFVDCASQLDTVFKIVSFAIPNSLISPESEQQYLVQSPYIGRARSDQPFDNTYRIALATALAEQFLSDATEQASFLPNTDGSFLRSAIISWMVGNFVEVGTESYLIQSIVDNYGTDGLANLIDILDPNSMIAMLPSVVQVSSIESAQFDWRDYIDWLINLESQWIVEQNEADWQTIYDFRDESLRQVAYERYRAAQLFPPVQIISTQLQTESDGTTQLIARVRFGQSGSFTEDIIRYNLVNNIWKRIS